MSEYSLVEFKRPSDWRRWLDENQAIVDGVWLRIYKKASGRETVSYAQALDEALCYGWIDGLRKGYDEVSFIQKFTPRRKNSLWSKRNIEYVERLTANGSMMPAGVAEVDRAKADGRWQAAYDKASQIQEPEYLLAALAQSPKTKAYYESLNKANRFAILWRLQTAKTDITRQRRLDKIMGMLDKGLKFH